MSLTDILIDIAAGVAVVETIVYGAKGFIYALKNYKNTDDLPSQNFKTFCKLPTPIDGFYFVYAALG